MKLKYLFITLGLLLSGCDLSLPSSNNSSKNSTSNTISNSLSNTSNNSTISPSNSSSSSSNSYKNSEEQVYEHVISAYFDYEWDEWWSKKEEMIVPLFYDFGGPNSLFSLKKYGIYNVIGGDKITICTPEMGLYISTIYPGIINEPSTVYEVKIEEIPVFEFNVIEDENSNFTLYCSQNDQSFELNNPIITGQFDHSEHEEYYDIYKLIDNNSVYNGMKLYGTFNEDNTIKDLYSYNPRVDKNKKLTRVNELNSLTLIDKEDNKGIFINNSFLITTDITNYDDLVIGNEYKIELNNFDILISNSFELQYLIKPQSITLENEFIKDTLDIKIFSGVEEYDGMPTIDENGNYGNSYRFINSYYNCVSYNLTTPSLPDPLSLEELLNSYYGPEGTKLNLEYENVYSNYRGFSFIKDDNKEQYLLNKDFIIEQDILIFVHNISVLVYV